jgi:hypothetical protein
MYEKETVFATILKLPFLYAIILTIGVLTDKEVFS